MKSMGHCLEGAAQNSTSPAGCGFQRRIWLGREESTGVSQTVVRTGTFVSTPQEGPTWTLAEDVRPACPGRSWGKGTARASPSSKLLPS